MAVLAIAALGSAAGAAIGGTFLGVTAASWGWMAGSALGNALFGGTKSQGPRLGDLKFTGTEYGQPVPWVAGSPRVSGQVIWASTKRELPSTESVGKGGGSEYTSYTYEVDLLMLLSENTTAGVSRVWSNGELVFNGATTRDGVWSDLVVYTGAADQLPDPTYEAAVGLGNAPAYRGRTTVLIRGLQLGNSGQLPNLTFEFGDFDYSSTILRAPMDLDNGTADLRPAPINGVWTGSGSAYVQRDDGIEITGANTSLVFLGNELGTDKLDINQYPGDVAVEFDYTITAEAPSVDAKLVRMVDFPSGDGRNHALRWLWSGNVRYLQFFTSHLGAVSANIPAPASGRIRLQYSPDASTCTLFLNNTQVHTTSTAGSFKNWQQIVFQLGSSVPWPGVQAFKVGRLLVYAGDPPAFRTYPAPLRTVVDQLMLRAGYQPGEWDSTDLAAEERPVRALALAQVGTTRAALEVLASAYFFNARKGDRIVFQRRASATTSAIAWDDLATAPDSTASAEPFELNTGSDMEVPAQIALTYPNMAGDYAAATEHSARLLGAQDSTQAVQLGLGMLPAEAKLVADALLFDQVTGMVTASISLPPAYSHLQPGAVLLVPDGRGRTHRMRVERRTETALVCALDLVQDDPGALLSAAVTDTGYALTDNVRQLAPTWWQALDIPLLRDGDNAPGYYVAMAPNKAAATDIWRGAIFVRAWGAEQYETAATSDQAATLGSTTAALPAWDGRNVMDEAATLLVRVSGQLASSTREAMQADLSINVLALGSEVLRFRGAELLGTTDGENDYRLTGLLRAQIGTEWAAATTHPTGTRVVLLSGALRRVTDQPSQVGTPSTHKAVSQGLLLGSVTAQDFTNTGVCLRPLAPVHLRAARAGGDLSITWHRRTRLGYRYGGAVGVSVPLGEEAEAYRVDVYQGATLLRSISTATPAATYTAAQQTADGLASGAAISLQVVQRSATVGDGYPTSISTTTP